MKIITRVLIGLGALVALLAVLSLTLLNKQSPMMRKTMLMREARLAIKTRDYDDAIDAYILAMSINRRDAQVYLSLSEACVFNGQAEDALYYLKLGMKNTNSAKVRDAHAELLKALSALPENGTDRAKDPAQPTPSAPAEPMPSAPAEEEPAEPEEGPLEPEEDEPAEGSGGEDEPEENSGEEEEEPAEPAETPAGPEPSPEETPSPPEPSPEEIPQEPGEEI